MQLRMDGVGQTIMRTKINILRMFSSYLVLSFYCYCFFAFVFETKSHTVSQASLTLTMAGFKIMGNSASVP